ncbi:MAG: hypothetical protein PHG34_06730 [Candidatus Cloacimonetes bacterium]|nr:hypothetical protein [Candidatus Cloacimonadota bacterium]
MTNNKSSFSFNEVMDAAKKDDWALALSIVNCMKEAKEATWMISKIWLIMEYYKSHNHISKDFSIDEALELLDSLPAGSIGNAEIDVSYYQALAYYSKATINAPSKVDELLQALSNPDALITISKTSEYEDLSHSPKQLESTNSAENSSSEKFRNLTLAYEAIEMALSLNKEDTNSLWLKTAILHSQGLTREAISILDKIISIAPDNQLAVEEKISLLDVLEDDNALIDTLGYAIDQFQDNQAFYLTKVSVLLKQTKLKQASDTIKEAIAIHPNSPDLLLMECFNDAYIKIPAEELVTFSLPTLLHYVDYVYANRILSVLLDNHKYEDAIQLLLKIFRVIQATDYEMDDLSELFYHVYDALYARKDYENALRLVNATLDVQYFPELYWNKLYCLIELNDLEKIVYHVRTAWEKDEYDESCWQVYQALWGKEYYGIIIAITKQVPEIRDYYSDWFCFWSHVKLVQIEQARAVLADFHINEFFASMTKSPEEQENANHGKRFKIQPIFELEFPYSEVPSDLFIDLLAAVYTDMLSKEDIQNQYDSLMEQHDSELQEAKTDNKRMQVELGIRLKLIKEYLHKSTKLPSDFTHFMIELQFGMYTSINHIFYKLIQEEKINERNRILSNLSHSIKNILRSVIDPLINLRGEFPQKSNVIDNAIKGAHLIREIVNSINLSYETNIEDISWDISHPDAESISLQEMLLNSLKYSVGNMFDFRYFPQYAENYYPRSIPKDDFDSIKAEWNAVSSVHDFEPLIAFAEKHLCKMSVKLSEAAQYKLGNEKSSAIKLMIMFQEIIFNAVKYASFVPRAERFLEIRLDNTETTIIFEVSNSYSPEVQAKTTGVGKLVIENFSTILGTNPELKTTDTTYSISIEFNNLWRNNAKDTVH